MEGIDTSESPAATVSVPGSKSYTQRALTIAALAEGKSCLHNVLMSEDTEHLTNALRCLGADIVTADHYMIVEGTGGSIKNPHRRITVGNNGTALRFLTALAALGEDRYIIDGNPRLRERPIRPLLDALQILGVGGRSLYNQGYPPVTIEGGGIGGGAITFAHAESSQYISSILISAPYARDTVTINLQGTTVSLPYINMTTDVMEHFGVKVTKTGEERYIVHAPQRYTGTRYMIEGDVSSASYFFLAAALCKRRIRVLNINPNTIQGDIAFLDIMELLGCHIERGNDWIEVAAGKGLNQGEYVFTMRDMPDMVPTLAVLSAFRPGRTVITDVAHLRLKESNRIEALVKGLNRINIDAKELTDGLAIDGGIPCGAEIETYNDHRIAMSFAIAGLATKGITIKDKTCVDKSFPGFWDELDKLDS
ncbi:MAG: 3-phosphoshikimate 1-carboxyvinyltransferase [Thermodesulfobacteriota bacterium]|nr:3-phosphoshikimate 1-carboxyvinyltransferase [Thermodesulfobacteriota bacterium]